MHEQDLMKMKLKRKERENNTHKNEVTNWDDVEQIDSQMHILKRKKQAQIATLVARSLPPYSISWIPGT